MFLTSLTDLSFMVLQELIYYWPGKKILQVAFIKESDNTFGLNVGVGSCMKITEQFDLYLEAKYIVCKYHQFMINAGVLINLDWLKKHENPGV